MVDEIEINPCGFAVNEWGVKLVHVSQNQCVGGQRAAKKAGE
jgi:hypothetical protein